MKQIASLGEQSQAILDSVMDLIYHMRGGVSYTEAMNMSAAERISAVNVLNDIIKKTPADQSHLQHT